MPHKATGLSASLAVGNYFEENWNLARTGRFIENVSFLERYILKNDLVVTLRSCSQKQPRIA